MTFDYNADEWQDWHDIGLRQPQPHEPALGLFQMIPGTFDKIPSTEYDEANVQAAINYMRKKGYLPPKYDPGPVVTRVYGPGFQEIHGLKPKFVRELHPGDPGYDNRTGAENTTQFEIEFSTAGNINHPLLERLFGMTTAYADDLKIQPREVSEEEQRRKFLTRRITHLRHEARQLNLAVIRRNRLIQKLYARLEEKDVQLKRALKDAREARQRNIDRMTSIARANQERDLLKGRIENLQARYDSDMASAKRLPTPTFPNGEMQIARIESLQASYEGVQQKYDNQVRHFAETINAKNKELADAEERIEDLGDQNTRLMGKLRTAEGDSAWHALKTIELKRRVKGLKKDLKKAVATKK
jgi:hypothetical protein